MFHEYGRYFNVYLSKLKQSQTYFKFCDSDEKLYTGSVRLVGAGGSITGHDADWIIVDDPYKGLAEELTPTALQKKVGAEPDGEWGPETSKALQAFLGVTVDGEAGPETYTALQNWINKELGV